MGIKVTWYCDGCDKAADATKAKPGDWSKITVMLDGFGGYPIGDYANGERNYELCPSCQRMLREHSNPREWPRASAVEKLTEEASNGPR